MSSEQKIAARSHPSDTNWDEIWRRDAGNFLAAGPSTRTRIRLALRMLKKYGRPDGSLLDVGCGSGLLLGCVAGQGWRGSLVGTDVSAAALDIARARHPSFSFHLLDIQSERLPQTFDTIVSLATIDIIEDDAAALRTVAPMMAPQGRLILSVQHNPAYWSRLDDLRAWRRYTPQDLASLGRAAGLRMISYFSWGWPLYFVYYKLLERHSEGARQQGDKGKIARLMGRILYWLFFFDDLFIRSGKGRQLFAVFEKI